MITLSKKRVYKKRTQSKRSRELSLRFGPFHDNLLSEQTLLGEREVQQLESYVAGKPKEL